MSWHFTDAVGALPRFGKKLETHSLWNRDLVLFFLIWFRRGSVCRVGFRFWQCVSFDISV